MHEQFKRGIEQFNACFFFECHDTLEDLWHETRGEDRLFLQGLIQISVGFYHLSNRNFKGSASQFTRGLKKLERYRPVHGGIEVEQFSIAVVPWLAIAEQGIRGEALQVDEAQFPKIQFV